VDGVPRAWYTQYGEIISLAAFAILLYFLYASAKRAKK
jgi:hypothetical protein